MNNVCDVLESLEATGSRLDKEKILKENSENMLLQQILKAGLDPYVNYYVSKFKKPVPAVEVEDKNIAMGKFLIQLGDLSSRKFTGNAARDFVNEIFSSLDQQLQKWAERIILKNLRIGIQATTVNKIWPGAISTFKVALADTLDAAGDANSLNFAEPVKFPCYVEPKLDGLRLIAFKHNGVVNMFTRNGTVLDTLPTIQKVLESAGYDNVVLDGEIMGADWNESASIVMSHKKQKNDKQLIFHVFDAISNDDWVEEKSQLRFEDRIPQIDSIISTVNSQHVRRVATQKVSSEDEIFKLYSQFLSEGYEGVMIKDPGSPYQWKRSKAILKLKPFCTHEGVVVGWYKGGVGTKRENEFGGFEVKLPNGVVTRVGSGFTDSLKSEINTKNPDSYIGSIVECQAQPPLTEEGCMRFPVYIRFRDESDVAKEVLEVRDSDINR